MTLIRLSADVSLQRRKAWNQKALKESENYKQLKYQLV
jgi:hypothetical protein